MNIKESSISKKYYLINKLINLKYFFIDLIPRVTRVNNKIFKAFYNLNRNRALFYLRLKYLYKL